LYKAFLRAVHNCRSSEFWGEDAFTPLLEVYGTADKDFHVGHVARLLGHVASMVLNWVLGLGISFNIRGGVSTFSDPDSHEWSLLEWSAYAGVTSLAFITTASFLENALVLRAERLAEEAGVPFREVEARLEESVREADGQSGLLWYQENVVVPMLALVEEGPGASAGSAKGLSRAQLLEKQTACLNTVLAFMAGFAWNNAIAVAITGKPAQLAPVVERPWLLAAVTTVVSVAASMAAGVGHARLRASRGLLGRGAPPAAAAA